MVFRVVAAMIERSHTPPAALLLPGAGSLLLEVEPPGCKVTYLSVSSISQVPLLQRQLPQLPVLRPPLRQQLELLPAVLQLLQAELPPPLPLRPALQPLLLRLQVCVLRLPQF